MSAAGLNIAQLQAVHYTHGPCLVLAGAGSGKTRVITHKIARLLDTGTAPEAIAAITFTNKAALEMRERARELAGKRAAAVQISTFHALGVRILREDGAALGLKTRFSILDTDETLALIKDCAGTTDANLARQWQWTISGWKSAGLTPDAALAGAQSEGERQAALVMARYAERLAAYQSVDFDDLIALPVRLLQKEELIVQKWRDKLAHVLIDEYQDTNATQYLLLKLLTGPQGVFTAVGDDDQSIYGWRGATLDNLRQLPQDYPRLKVIKLEQNYRSTNAILRAANQLIAPNPKLYPKRLFSELGEGEPVRITPCDHEAHEAERAVVRLQMLHAAGQRWCDCAILYRANHQAKVFEQALRHAQIPYKVSGGQSFFDRAEIKDLCAWLRLIVNEDDDPAFLRAIVTPKRGIGHQTLAQLADFAAHGHMSLFEALSAHSLEAALSARAAAGLREFGHTVNDLQYRAGHTIGEAAARALLIDWLTAIGYERHLLDHADTPAQGAARWANVLDFCDWMARRCGGAVEAGIRTPETNLLDVAQTVSLISTLGEREANADVITLSTLHAAKGLEWPHVILAGVVEGLLPFKADVDAPETAAHIEEERRLMYVGITRARQTLTVSWTRRRKRARDIVACRPSRFIAEMRLDETQPRTDPRAQLRALRAEFARRAGVTETPPDH